MHERKIWDRYLVGMLGILCLFTLALATFIKIDRHMPEGIVRTMILVSPLAALLPFMWAVVRVVRRDEVIHTRKIWFRYLAELSAAFLVYALVLVLVHRFGFPMHKGIGRTLLLVSPTLSFFLIVWAVVRQFRRMDEYGRFMSLESIAMAFGITAGWVVTYGFMENAGYPRLSMFSVWMVMMSAWAVITIARGIAGR
jgi:small-conductance mechanosensitive channel